MNMLMLTIIKSIVNHPLNKSSKLRAIIRFFKWQICSIINPYPIIFPFLEKSKLIIWKGLTGATGNIYCGLDEFEDMAFVLHFLRKEDLFIDIGANIGSYSILAGGEVGAETISIEPIPTTFNTLQMNIRINNTANNFKALNIGLGSKKGILKFTKALDTENHVATEQDFDTIDVHIEKLDSIVDLNRPTLIKMDVEGYEIEVLNGMQEILMNKNLKAIIIELNGLSERYGFDEDNIHKLLLSFDFKPFYYKPFSHSLDENKATNNTSNNIVYIRDISFVNDRLNTAKKFKIFGQEI